MSGGVDSSVVAKLMSEQDYDLSAIYMRNWDTRDESGTDDGCEWKKDWADVQRVCKALDIPVRLVDLSREYWTRVFEPSLVAWEAGATPNPDIWCNQCARLGHYARKSWSTDKDSHRPKLLRPVDQKKDQSYYLSRIPELSLARTLFPLESYTKPDIRKKAREWGLATAERGESMGICFVGQKRRFADFISQYIPPKRGDVVHAITGKVLGTHQGLWAYTIGQNARIPGGTERMFVSHKDPPTNKVFVVEGSDNPILYQSKMLVKDFRWIWADSPPALIDGAEGFRARVQFRHRMQDVGCIVRKGPAEGQLAITLDVEQKAITPGQVAAVYDGEWCLGSGTIMSAN
ncbi:5-methylaminomethyl-2-thiouridylate-methyltransferase [Trametopsis cervina]|nr:5-methylaminomethyl-2-thiouridylate-methyltransferase [Trametopsis cervina]